MSDAPDYEVVARGGAAYAGVIREIANERVRQVEAEGWTPEHDDSHINGQMARAAAVYANRASDEANHRAALRYAAAGRAPLDWPWASEWFKPKNRRRDLVRAGALIIAEIERIDRAAAKAKA